MDRKLIARMSFVMALLLPGISYADTLAKIERNGVVNIGVRSNAYPLSFVDEKSGEVAGYHVDACKRIVEVIKREIRQPEIKTKYVAVEPQNRLPLLTDGIIDIECGSTTNTPLRSKEVDFAPTTFLTQVRMLVRKASGLERLSDLDGKSVVTTSGTTSVKVIRDLINSKHLNIREVYGKDHEDSLKILMKGEADAFVMDEILLAGILAREGWVRDYEITGEALSEESIAIMLRKNDPGFKRLVDSVVNDMKRNGEMKALYEKWFTSGKSPSALNVPPTRKIKDLLGFGTS